MSDKKNNLEKKGIFEEIKKANKYHFDLNNFGTIIKNQKKELIKKIIIANVGKRFDYNFKGSEAYFNELTNFIENNIFKKNDITINIYKQLYQKLFEPFYKKKDLTFRNVDITANIGGNIGKDTYTSAKNIIKELETTFNKYNNKNIELFERLYIISIDILSKTHPFYNNNFLFISILLDILLVKNGFLPIGLKKTFKDNNLFLPNKITFYKIILLRYKKYSY